MRRRPATWRRLVLAVLLLGAMAGVGYAVYPSKAATDPGSGSSAGSGLSGGPGSPGTRADNALPAPVSVSLAKGKAKPEPASAQERSAAPAAPQGLSSYTGSLILDATGSQLASWNQTSSYCPSNPGWSPTGTVSTDSAGDVTLTTTGSSGSCAALISPDTYSSGVIEADIDFPADPGHPGEIANWTSFWLTNAPAWPADGELDAVEVEPVNGVNAVTWHSGTSSDLFGASTDSYAQVVLPAEAPNLTPGWHTVDVVYTRGFFAVYYDGRQFTSYSSANVTGSPLNIYLTTGVTPDTSEVAQSIGGAPVNSDHSPATLAVKYIKVWSYK